MLKSTFTGLQRCRWQRGSIFIHLAVVASKSAKFSAKIRTYSRPRSSKVINLGANRKRIIMQLPISQVTLGVSPTVFENWRILLENSLFSPPYLCLTPPSGGTPCDINVIYTSLESKFNGLQFCRWQYGSVFIHLAVVVFVGFQIYEISRNSKRIWAYIRSRSSKVIDLGVNRKSICDFLLVINSNFGRISYPFRDTDV